MTQENSAMHKLEKIVALVALSVFAVGTADGHPAATRAAPSPLSDEKALMAAKQALSHADSNHDGRISRAEMLAFGMTKGRNNLVEKHWKIADRNRDGYLSLDELVETVKYISAEQARQKSRG